ncbi:MAG: heme-binding domain-containing protein [Candidatus Krumholzibacteriia bacterium]
MGRVTLRRLVLLVILLVAVAIQFFPTGLDRAPADPHQGLEAVLQPGPEVVGMLGRACNDCHGTARAWPWYASVAPASWLVAHDVREAKKDMDFTHWAQYTPHAQARKLAGMCEKLQKGEMPLQQYLWMHRDARLSPAEVQLFCAWTDRERTRLGDAR